MKTVAYYQDGSGVNPDVRARSLRIGRFELCCAWVGGGLPSWFFWKHRGTLHPGAVSTTFRAFRVAVGYRWYQPPANPRKE